MPRPTTTKPEPVPAGPATPTPVEDVPPTRPAPAPEPAPEPTAEELDARATDLRGRTRTNLLGQEVTWPLSAGEAIAEVTRRIGAIEKTGRSTEGYRFRGIDQALAALHPILGDVGLVILPGKVVREHYETRATSKGGTLNVVRLLVRYTFVGPDGSELRGEAWGEGGDSGDKATQKAHSQSYKTLVFQTFTIPTEQSAEDEPDATNEAARPFSAEERHRADSARSAAAAAETVEALAGVRRRALSLLAVPVLGDDNGTLAPLSYWIDARRAELERHSGEPA